MNADSIAIVDCHAHFLDAQLHTYPIFKQRSPGFEALVGDYSSLPRRYLPEDYLKDVNGFNVVKTVWPEFMSTDPMREVRWAKTLSYEEEFPNGIIALVDFLNRDVEAVLDSYGRLRRVRAVRQHLAWHPSDPLKRFAARPDILMDKAWQGRVALLREYDLRCEIEVFSTQLGDLRAVARSYPDIQFVLPVMGWPVDVTEAGHREWGRDMRALGTCSNVAVKIFGMECIFGCHWTVEQIRPWILDTIELFGPDRCMFGSHMPIAKLACSFPKLYGAYFDVVSDFTASDKWKLFHDTAITIYGLTNTGQPQESRQI